MATTYTDCITFTGETSDFTLKAKYKEWNGTVEYSTDHNTWTVWNGTEVSSVSGKLYLRGSGNTTFYTSKGARFVLSARAACSGNIQTLLEYSNPPTTLADYCYYSMFYGCKSLRISSTQSSKYPTAWQIPSSGTISSEPSNWNYNMLSGTGGTFTSNPSINTTYYGAWTVVETYNISYNLTNCTGASTNPTTIDEGTTATLSFTSNDGYSFPDTITVSGVESHTWDKSTGTLTLTNATSDVSITITCIVAYPKINSFTYYGKQINNINGKPIRYVHYMGNTYEMVYLDADGNYLRDANGYVLQDSDGNYLEFTEALATPQNVTANGTTVSWDEVENATSYAVLADGSEIGTVEGTTQDASYIVTIDDVTNDEYDYIQISVTCNGEQISSGDSVAKNAQIHITYTANFASVTIGLVINGEVVNEVWSPAIGEYDYTVTSDTNITWV